MRKFTKIACVVGVIAILPVAAAYAQMGKKDSTRAILQALKASKTDGALPSAAIVSRSGTFFVKASFSKHTAVTGTVFCSGTVSNINGESFASQYVSQTEAVTFSGSTGTCSVAMPYKWTAADDEQGVDVELQLSNGDCMTGGSCSASTRIVFNVWELKAALPANGNKVFDFGTLPF